MLAIIFWVFLLMVCLVIPGIMIVFAGDFIRGGNKIDKFYGYRTKMSMKNNETWRFAHTFCGNLWKRWGKFMLKSTLFVMAAILAFAITSIYTFDSDIAFTVVSIAGGSVVVVQLVLSLAWEKTPASKRSVGGS